MYPRKLYKNGLVITKAQLDKNYCAFLITEILHGATCYLMFPNDTARHSPWNIPIAM